MFVKDENDKRAVLIVDMSHLFYKYAFGGASQLSSTIMVDGVPKVVDTTLPSYTIKILHKWAHHGVYPTVACFDSNGSNKCRKAYFKKNHDNLSGGSSAGYKESRGIQDNRFYEGINITMNLLVQGGVCCLKADGYEADDLIKAAVDKAKEQYPNLPIHIVTGDQDLIPLVDDQVSVFLASKKLTWAESPEFEKNHYVQLTPYNIQDYVESLTEFKGLTLPYNTVLLKKLLRGKKADDIPAYPKFTPTKFNNLVNALKDDGYDLGSLFRYDSPMSKICYRGTEEPIPEDLIESTPKEKKMIKFYEPKKLTEMCDILSNYLDDDIISHIRLVYNGVNLNGAFTGMPEPFNRRPAVMKVDITGYSETKLQSAVSVVQIRLIY